MKPIGKCICPDKGYQKQYIEYNDYERNNRAELYPDQAEYDPDYNTVYCFKPCLNNDMARERKLGYMMEKCRYNQQRNGRTGPLKVTILSNEPKKIITIRQDEYNDYRDYDFNNVKYKYVNNYDEQVKRNNRGYENGRCDGKRCICGLGDNYP